MESSPDAASELSLSSREAAVLQEVIETFLQTGEPVSSLRLVRSKRLQVSAATIRSVMSRLEEQGLLRQPHASAGRTPTAAGYHLYIESLMAAEAVSDEVRLEIDQTLGAGPVAPDQIADRASRLLSEFSKQLGLVVTPDLGGAVLRRVEFVPLSDRRVLCISVSTAGCLDNKVIETEESYSAEDLRRYSNYVSENFGGMTLGAVRERLIELMNDARVEVDSLLRGALELARQGVGGETPQELVLQGTGRLLRSPELNDLGRVKRLFETFSDRSHVVGLLNQCLEGPGVRVFIGEENDLTSELDCSLILRGYHLQGRRIGSIGVFGPSRMPYQRLIPLVDYLGLRLSRSLDGLN